jgi:hypothetical protein
MTTPLRNVPLELAALVILSALLGALSVVVVLLVGDLVQGRGLNFAALTRSDSTGYYWLVSAGLAGTALIWYFQRGYAQPFVYWKGVIWGLVCFALTAAVVLIPQLPSAIKDPVLGLFGTLFFVYVAGGAFSLPAIFTVAPLTVWLWHTVIAAMRS